MDKKKQMILIGVIAVVAIILIGITSYFLFANKSENEENEVSDTKINKLYETLQSKGTYQVTAIANSQDMEKYAKNGNEAYLSTNYDGENSTYIIKDGNTYLIVDDDECYYTFENNDTNLKKFEDELQEAINQEIETGEEKIDNETYKYEKAGTFMYYFKGNRLEYIKKNEDGKEKLYKTEISYDVDDNLFQIPSNYKQK